MYQKRVAFWLVGVSVLVILAATTPWLGRAGTAWSVDAKMSLAQIQAVIDSAVDGDTIIFEKGAYDFSGATFRTTMEYIGALNIVDKSLVIQGKKGAIIKGTPSILNSSGFGQSGIIAFLFKNTGRDKDVAIRGFELKTMLLGIGVYGCRNVAIEGCYFNDMDRNGIGVTGAGGDLTIAGNRIASWRCGIFVDWWYFDPAMSGHYGVYWQTPGTVLRIEDNILSRIGAFPGSMGIYINRLRDGLIAGNSIVAKGGEEGIYIASMPAPDGTPSAPRCVISGNEIEGCRYGIDITSGSGVHVVENTVVGTDWGVDLVYSSGCAVQRNTISDVVAYGVYLYGYNCSGHEVADNLIRVAGYPDSDPNTHSYGIITMGHDNVFSGNRVSGTGTAAFFVYATPSLAGHNEVFECNNARNFKPAAGSAHYVFFTGTYANRFTETWANGVTYIDLGSGNAVTASDCL